MRIMYRRLLFLWNIHVISNLNATTIFNVTLDGAYKTVLLTVMKRKTETFFESGDLIQKIDNMYTKSNILKL